MPALRAWWRYQHWKVRGIVLLGVGRSVPALACFDAMLALRPLDSCGLASRAHARAQLRNLAGAVADLRLLTQVQPRSATAWFNLGYALQQQGQSGEAESAFECALAINPQLDRAWYGLALALMEASRLPEAVQALDRNTALQPMSPYGWYRLAQVRLAMGQPEEALRVIAHLRQFEPRVAARFERETGLVPRLESAALRGPAPAVPACGATDAA